MNTCNNKILVDQTELTGGFDFTLRYTPSFQPPPGMVVKGESIPMFDALEKQLGLKLELTTTPLPVHSRWTARIEKPTENSARSGARVFRPPRPSLTQRKSSPPRPARKGAADNRKSRTDA